MRDLDVILKDPSAAFSGPRDVLAHVDLSHEDKIRVLRQWRYDLVQLQVASAENLDGDSDAGAGIKNIDECLRQLGAKAEIA